MAYQCYHSLDKSGNPFSPDNYRAIAVGSCMGKLFSSIVCRDLPLQKITCLGITGNFFNCLSDMYKNSIVHIKMSKLLSPKIDIGKGTEQGHPLFKLYINDLSSLLKSVGDYPVLADVLISHLLWADDLVLLALSPNALQYKETDIVIIFSPLKRKQFYETFNWEVSTQKKSCYLGIIFHRNRSFMAANTELRVKALRALYDLKGNIVKDTLSKRALNILFDSLIKPILLYGCQVLCPHS